MPFDARYNPGTKGDQNYFRASRLASPVYKAKPMPAPRGSNYERPPATESRFRNMYRGEIRQQAQRRAQRGARASGNNGWPRNSPGPNGPAFVQNYPAGQATANANRRVRIRRSQL